MRIVVTNDDGINNPAIHVLAKAVQVLGEVTVIAPNRNWSASGHQKTLGRPMRVHEHPFENGIKAYATDCSPSDCAALAGLGFLGDKPDLIVSGINPNANLGLDLTYSGTVSGAIEATVWGIPGIAFSIDGPRGVSVAEFDFSAAETLIPQIIRNCLSHQMPPYTIMNVNLPYLPLDEIKGFAVTRGGDRFYRDRLVKNIDPFGVPYYWFGGDPPDGDTADGTDSGELAKGYVSLTPVTMDMTATKMLSEVEKWEW